MVSKATLVVDHEVLFEDMKIENLIYFLLTLALISFVGVDIQKKQESIEVIVAENNHWLKEMVAVGSFYSIKQFGDFEVILVPIAMNAFVDAQERFKSDYDRYFRIQSSYRTGTAQTWLFNMFQQGQNPYPVATPNYSYHELGLAVDVYDSEWEIAKPYLEEAGFRWLGVEDPIHFDFGFGE